MGAEALLRWTHAELGNALLEAISVAEDCGLDRAAGLFGAAHSVP